MKNSFVMYNSYIDQIELLSREQRGDLLTAIFSYSNGLDLPEMDSITQMAFSFIKTQMDKDIEKYNETIEKRSEAGKISGKVRAEKAEQKGTKRTSVNSAEQKGTKRTSVNSAEQKGTKRTSVNSVEQKGTKRTVYVDVDVNEDVDESEDVDVDDNDVLKNENNKKENVLTDIREKSAQEHAFDQFWDLYPKKKSKGQAKRAWDKLKLDQDTIMSMMAKLPELIASDDWRKDDGQYIPYPATWLNAEGWKDEVGRPLNKYEEVDRWAQAISQF